MPPAPQVTRVEAETAAAVRIHEQVKRRDAAIQRLRREDARLDLIVAELVSSQPESPAWYLHAGTLTPAQAQGAASLTELGLHRLMERYRSARSPGKPRKRRRRRAA